MGTTKAELAKTLGVSKSTVVNYIERLDLKKDHIKKQGKFDILDDYAVSALADAIGKAIPTTKTEQVIDQTEQEPADSVVEALNAYIASLEKQLEEIKAEKKEQADQIKSLNTQLETERDRYSSDMSRAQEEVSKANDRASELSNRVASIAERQQAIAALPWWQRGKLAVKLLGSGSIDD